MSTAIGVYTMLNINAYELILKTKYLIQIIEPYTKNCGPKYNVILNEHDMKIFVYMF